MALSVAKPTAQPKLTVAKPKPQPKVVVVPNYGMQGSTGNPQQPTTRPIQGSNYNPQQTYNPQGATYNPQQAAQAAELARIAVAQEIARQKEVKRVEVQGQVNSKVATNKAAFTLQVANPAWQGKLALGKKMKLPKIVLPEQTEYEKAYADAYWKAMGDVKNKQKVGHQNLRQKVWDKVTGGSDRRAIEARNYAGTQATKVVDQSTNAYKKNLDGFLKTQASKKAAVEGAKFLTQAQFDKAAAEYTAWETAEIKKLERQRAMTNAQIDAYGKASSAPLTSKAAKAASMFNRNVIHGAPGSILGNVWNYTLGQGSKNVPSLVTAPGRIVNWAGNLNTKDRTIYQEGGKSFNRDGSKLNAWQASQGQRSFNLKPYVDVKSGKEADKLYGDYVKSLIIARKKIGTTDKDKLDYNKVMAQHLAAQNKLKRNQNSLADNAFDPINYVGGTIGKSGVKLGEKLIAPVKASKFGSWLGKASEKVSSNKAIQWLGAEHKSPEQHLADAIDEAKGAQAKAQGILPRVNEINKQIAAAGGQQLDVSGLTGLRNLTDSEVPIFKRMVDGKLSARDRAWLIGPGNAATRAKLEGIATAWQDFAEKMRLHDEVINTRFGKGKKTYAPDTTWIDKSTENPLSIYNFKKFKKGKGPRSADDFYQSAVDRYFKSNVDGGFSASQMTKSARLKAERDALLHQYDTAVEPKRAAVQKAYDKTRTPFNRARRVAGVVSPTKLWKKSVLKYRPAWTVNNVLYNTQAAVLAGGPGALAEQAKMLRPKYWRKAMDESRKTFGGNLSKEIGKGRLNRFYTGVEDWSRVAGGRAALKKGMSEEQALKRVNRYLFDYKTRNWERPIKAAIPFWQFQKNLAKAAAVMPFDRPLAAKGYNLTDRYQQQQYDNDFNTLVPELKKLGYTDAEIEKFRADNAKYYHGRLKVGGKYITTPFNAFSEKQMSQLGFNPFLAAAGETADSVDSFGRKVKGKDASWWRRLASKFPQVDLAIQAKQAHDVQAGVSKPHSSWIAQAGHEGYGLTKEKQGYDKSKTSYVRSMDPRAKLGQNALAMLGVPRGLEFNKKDFLQHKRLQKATSSYFATDWDKVATEKGRPEAEKQKAEMLKKYGDTAEFRATNWDDVAKSKGYKEMQKAQSAMFKKYGLTPDDFFKGVLAKYDTDQTKNIKKLKETAQKQTSALFDEYAKQPAGTRNLWATNKLSELVNSGYFDKNPFLKSFGWVNPTTVAKANKQALVQEALRTGNWSKYQAKFGLTQKQKDYQYAAKTGDWSSFAKKYGVKSQKAKAYMLAESTGNWAAYRAAYGTKSSPFQAEGKFFKTAESMQKYKDGQFWRKYALADRAEKKRLLADNPQYNTRSNWTSAQWTAQKVADKAKLKSDLQSVTGFGSKVLANSTAAQKKANIFLSKGRGRSKKVKWSLS